MPDERIVEFDCQDGALRGRRARATREQVRMVVEECGSRPHGDVPVAVGGRGVAEPPPLGLPSDQDLVVVVDSSPAAGKTRQS